MHFVRFFTYIAFCLSVARAFSVSVGTPTQCDPLTISWTGGQAPFEILLTPAYQVSYSYSVPASAFSNGKGSYSISQLPLSTQTKFLLTMSDATGFGTGGTTNNLTVGNPTTNNNCNAAIQSPPFTFSFSSPSLTQCSLLTISANGSEFQPITIMQLIPGGQSVMFNSVDSPFSFVVDVIAGTDLLYSVTDSEGRSGGVSKFQLVSGSSNSSCLSANSPSSTAGMSATASPTSSSSSPSPTSSSSSSNVALIAGAAGGGGGAVLIALVILGMCLWRKRRASRSPDVQSSAQSHPRRLQHTDQKYEASPYSDVPPQSPFPYNANPLNHHTRPIEPSPRTQSDLTNLSTSNFAVGAAPPSLNQTQHSRQSSNTDSPGYGDARDSITSSAYNRISQPMLPNYPLQYPVGYSLPIRPGSQSPPLNPSTGNFTVSDHPTPFNQTLHSRQSSNADFAVYGDARSSATMSSADRRMTIVAETPSPLPWETDPVTYPGPPIQSGSQPSPINVSPANLAARDLPTPFNQTQNSLQSSDTDNLAVYGASGSQPVASASAQTAYQLPARIIVHTDAEDVVPDDNGVIELPPQYSELRGVRAL
ncbi:uncharacterized protein BJ212DRAFT_1369082 [Suillus subaureus]|uniref:Axial budding pattern protein 2 n=1 Tax=Suillus subaureus TaxID=48587 RepID=A0A9P7JB89_9AGAM|nr:uncharacterized protein BJ212DRAFT_1369082 [Suillus subaureus]KAG1812933.1 hypothetical protein BJ212DRAFT_1369082 [Suillus subaureus]